MTPELRCLLESYLPLPAPPPGQTREQQINFEAGALHYIVQTFEGYDGPYDLAEVKALLRATSS